MIALIIPAYKPDEKLLELVDRYRDTKGYSLVIVDDGSGEDFLPIFDRLPDRVTLLRHPENRGKGAALKTAMRYILERMPRCDIAVTADADGQHTVKDIERTVKAARGNLYGLTMGCRAFSGNVPLRSRFGNYVTRGVFAQVTGTDVTDTQTGLRAFGRTAMQRFIELPGERYEYEINMLLDAADTMTIAEVPIETIYIEENASSHFNPLRDSIRIYRRILGFAAGDLAGYVAGAAVFGLLCTLLAGCMPIGCAVLLATVLSAVASEAVRVGLGRRPFPNGIARLCLEQLLRYVGLLGCVAGLGMSAVWAALLWGFVSRIAHIVPSLRVRDGE